MSILMRTSRSRRSRRRKQHIRTAIIIGGLTMLMLAYALLRPVPPMTATAETAAYFETDTVQSVDTEGALTPGQQATDAALYAAER